jgi:eukaryotic-like serine/threonine-protein kinase
LNLWIDSSTARWASRRNAPPRNSAAGRVLAKRWTLLQPLGVGGTGTVYEAIHRNGRRVAVKVLHPELAHHPTIRKRFSSEGYAANRVRHADAVAVLDDGEEPDGTAFLVMELLEGRSLAKVLSERGALPVGEVVAVALSTLDVLAAAHDNGVIHRDVKPGNIFATVDGRFKLLDFGVAQVADLASSVVTQGGTVGTPAFMAPEQAAGRVQEIDALTDVWAVGATMFQLLTQRLVHEGSSGNAALFASATVAAPPIRSRAPHVPPELAEVIDRALKFERSERWPNARAMHLALRSACPDFASLISSEAKSLETVPEHELPPRRRESSPMAAKRKPTFGILIALSVLLVVGGAWVLRKPQKAVVVSTRATQATPRAAARAASSDGALLARTSTTHAFATPSASVSVNSKAVMPASAPRKNASPRPKLERSPDPSLAEDGLLDRRK